MVNEKREGYKDFVQKYKSAEPQCVKCKKNDFRLARMTDEQILAECTHCGTPHLLSADLVEGKAVITFWTELPPNVVKEDIV